MIRKPEYVEKVEDKVGVMSTLEIDFLNQDIKSFLDKRTGLTVVWSKSNASFNIGEIKYEEIIYKSKQEFYLYLLLRDEYPKIMVYYKQEQNNELIIFISQLLKQFKNDTTNK